MDSILHFYQYTIYFYTLVLTAFYLFLMISSYFMIEKIKVRYTKIEADLLLDLPGNRTANFYCSSRIQRRSNYY